MKSALLFVLAFLIMVPLVGCSNSSSNALTQTNEVVYRQETEYYVEEEQEESIEEVYEPLYSGGVVTSNDWNIRLTDAYTSTTLESSQSRTAWEANDGYAFLILEFDVTCLNSTRPTVDGDAVTELVATAGGNTYESWEYQYIDSEIWCYIRNNYLDANLPLHIYVYTMIPRATMNGDVSVNLKLAGQPKVITIH